MKKFRFLAVLALAISMLFVVAAAADINVSDVEYNGTDATITVTVKAASALAIDEFSSFQMSYDSAVFSVASTSSSDSEATINTATAGVIKWSNPNGVTNTAIGDKILEVVFNVTATDKTTAYGKQFVISDKNNTTMWTPTDAADYNGTITVKSAQTATTTTVNAASEGYTNVQGKSGDNIFGVWVGTYNVSAGDATKTITKAVVNFAAANKNFTADNLSISGKGTVTFKVAIVGVPEQYATGSTATLTIQ